MFLSSRKILYRLRLVQPKPLWTMNITRRPRARSLFVISEVAVFLHKPDVMKKLDLFLEKDTRLDLPGSRYDRRNGRNGVNRFYSASMFFAPILAIVVFISHFCSSTHPRHPSSHPWRLPFWSPRVPHDRVFF